METRAPYALIGLFVLAAVGAVFGFVYWLHNTGGLGERTVYRIRFENNVAGLLTGAAVLFNGIRVGEVIDLQLNPDNPREVTAAIAVVAGTPVRTDTRVGLEFQGLTGVPVISLLGGDAGAAPLASSKTDPAVLAADPTAGQSMTEVARQALRKLDTLLADNSDSLHSAIANLNTFSGALARNSDRVDSILTGLEHMAGGGAPKAAPLIYDLTAPRAWSDTIPKVLQEKIIQSFEASNYVGAVARPMEGLAADYQLILDLRSFRIMGSSTSPQARVEFAGLSATAVGSSDRGHSNQWSRPRK
jgi:phospholipid/cholesterol/gamma-HCH transport system substrate-binding protein